MQYPGSLHNHTDYSNLRIKDSINKIDTLVDYAIELGHSVVAFTEHECISNSIDIENYRDKIKEEHPDFKIILGNEIYLCRNGLNNDNFVPGEDKYFHFILLAKNAEGHKQIRELSTRAWLRSYMSRGMRRVPTYYSDLEDIIGSNPGNVILSTACLGSYIATQLMEEKPDYDKIKKWIVYMKSIAGNGNFYLEMQPARSTEQIKVNKEIVKLSEETNTPFIITNDAHYLKASDRNVHKAYLNSQDGEREVDEFYQYCYLMESNEIESLMDYFDSNILQTAYKNIQEIADSCEEYSLKKPLHIPILKWKECKVIIPANILNKMPNLKMFYESTFEGDRLLARKIYEKISSDERLQTQDIYDEVELELDIVYQSSKVNDTHWSSYFLNIQKIIDTVWESGSIVGAARGSGMGFLLLYLLDITQINPLWENTKTYPWRFLNPERVSVLDIDFDISGLKRQQVLDGFKKEFGEENVANVLTLGIEKSKSAILSAARGIGIDVDTARYIASLVPSDRGMPRTLKQCYYGDEENDFKPIKDFVLEMKKYPKLWETAQKIEGLVCRMGIHAGGVIFVDEPFVESAGLMRAPDGTIITCYDLHRAEDVSLIKYDALSVEAMDRIQYCIELLIKDNIIEDKGSLKETYESIVGVYNIERTNPKMWEMVWNHQIQSLFQMEQQSGLKGIALTKPKSVDELAVLNSVIRLMAPERGAEQPLDKYKRFRDNPAEWEKEMDYFKLSKEEKELIHRELDISNGMCITQEQFMKLVQIPECGGFDLQFADSLRKAIAKKNPAAYDELTKTYFEETQKKNLSKNLCNYVWNILIATNRGYGFNALLWCAQA